MKRAVTLAIGKLCGEAVFLTLLVGIIVAAIGRLNQWDTSVKYSNAFFIAGCLMIVGGAYSRVAAGQEWEYFWKLDSEVFRGMSTTERANFIINASSPVRLVVLGVLSGILLMLISVLIWDRF